MVLQPCEGKEHNEEDEEGQSLEGSQILELSMNLVVGLTSNHTMKSISKLKGEEILILKDSGATHNFIATKAVERLNLPIQTSKTFEVSLGDGYKVRGSTFVLTWLWRSKELSYNRDSMFSTWGLRHGFGNRMAEVPQRSESQLGPTYNEI